MKWLEANRIHFASLFLDRIMKRARYVRQSKRKVSNSLKVNRLQLEIYQMFIADKHDFKLSTNMLWQKIQMEMEAD